MVGAGDFEAAPGPSPDAVRLVLNIEIVAAKAFQRDRLFVEYHLKYDDTVWECGKATGYSKMVSCRLRLPITSVLRPELCAGPRTDLKRGLNSSCYGPIFVEPDTASH